MSSGWTGAFPSTSRGSASVPTGRFRGTSILRRCSRRSPSSSSESVTCSAGRRAARGTSSTSGTAYSRRRRSRRCSASWTGSMAAEGGGVAVLLMAYGGPGSLDEVEPYLQDVRGGRATAPELVAEITARYARIGGRSPILERTEAQARALQDALGPAWPVYVGMRHWHPFIAETVERMVACGQRRAVAIVLAPHYSALSVGAYENKLLDAAGGRLELALVRSWGDHPKFLEAVAERVRQALQRFPAPGAVQVLFTAHSLPERILATGDPYADELQASAAAVARLAGVREWRFAYLSAPATPEPRLGAPG